MKAKQLIEKALKVLHSCRSDEQLISAIRYCVLAQKTIKDRLHSQTFFSSVYPKIVELELKFIARSQKA